MAHIANTEIFGLASAIFRSGYPMLCSSPSEKEFQDNILEITNCIEKANYANSHIRRAIKLANAKGGGHDQFLSGIIVNFDLTISNKAWVEAERYKFLNFISSMSSMHRAASMPIKDCCNQYVCEKEIQIAETAQKEYNLIDGSAFPNKKRDAYLRLLYSLPSGFELMAGMTTNYRCLKNIYSQRRSHRLPDWHMVCNWIEQLPLSNALIIGGTS